jgi:hypothetical protein
MCGMGASAGTLASAPKINTKAEDLCMPITPQDCVLTLSFLVNLAWFVWFVRAYRHRTELTYGYFTETVVTLWKRRRRRGQTWKKEKEKEERTPDS